MSFYRCDLFRQPMQLTDVLSSAESRGLKEGVVLCSSLSDSCFGIVGAPAGTPGAADHEQLPNSVLLQRQHSAVIL